MYELLCLLGDSAGCYPQRSRQRRWLALLLCAVRNILALCWGGAQSSRADGEQERCRVPASPGSPRPYPNYLVAAPHAVLAWHTSFAWPPTDGIRRATPCYGSAPIPKVPWSDRAVARIDGVVGADAHLVGDRHELHVWVGFAMDCAHAPAYTLGRIRARWLGQDHSSRMCVR